MMKISLTSRGISFINPNFLPSDFTFVIVNHSYSCNKIQANFLSPKVSNMHKSDPLIDKFFIDQIKDPNRYFQAFIDFLNQGELNFDIANIAFYLKVSDSLGNNELKQILIDIASKKIEERKEFNVKEVIDQIKIADQTKINFPNSFFDYVASHFPDLYDDLLEQDLSLSTLEMIISNKSLKLQNEFQLISFIQKLTEKNNQMNYLSLLEFIDFNSLSVNELSMLQDFIANQEDSEALNNFMLRKLWMLVISKPNTNRKLKAIEFKESEHNNLCGIINYLNMNSNGISSTNGTIDVTSSSIQNATDAALSAKNLCNFSDLSENSMWSPQNVPKSYITFDFKNRKVKLENYTLHTPTDETEDYPKSWSIECSNDLTNWDIVDKKFNQEVMNRKNACSTFSCEYKNDNFYRYVRIKSQSVCWSGLNKYYFDLAAVEFFGFLKDDD